MTFVTKGPGLQVARYVPPSRPAHSGWCCGQRTRFASCSAAHHHPSSGELVDEGHLEFLTAARAGVSQIRCPSVISLAHVAPWEGSVGTAPSKLDGPVAPFRHRKPASPRVIANPAPNSAANATFVFLVCRVLLDVARTPEGDTRSSAGPGRCGYHRQRHKGSRAQQIHGELRPRSQQIHRQVITHAVA